MATHSSILAWKIPWTAQPGELQSMGSQKVGHDLLTKTTTNKNKHMAPTYSRPPLRPGISSPTLVAGHATGKAFFCALKILQSFFNTISFITSSFQECKKIAQIGGKSTAGFPDGVRRYSEGSLSSLWAILTSPKSLRRRPATLSIFGYPLLYLFLH